ncbi:MAG: putative quinol monooxygenase [Crocinitomicaceae bacterium]
MLVRIVKLTFKEEALSEFYREFETHKNNIASFPGCRGMKLLKGIDNPTVIMTYSHWDDKEALNKYRESDLFSGLWTKIKPMFGNKPEAWSHEIHFNGFKES